MPSTYTPRNRLEKQGTGENTNAWGAILNNRVFEMIDAMADGVASYVVNGAKTLTSLNGVADEARCRVQIITGGTGGTVTIPSVQKNYFVQNQSSADVVFTTGAGSTAKILANSASIVICDGANVFLTDPSKSVLVPSDQYHLTNKFYVDGAINAASITPGQLPNQAGKAGFAFFSNGAVADFRQILTSDVAGLDTYLASQATKLQTFTSSGVWTKPDNAAAILVEVWGAGGGGGGGYSNGYSGSGGGGGGGYNYRWFYASELPASVAVTIGAGGAGGAAGAPATNGGAGGTTTFGSFLYAGGGNGGQAPISVIGSTYNGGTGGSSGPVAGGNAPEAAVGGSSLFGGGGGGGGYSNTPGAPAGGASARGGGGGGGGASADSGPETAGIGGQGGAGAGGLNTGAAGGAIAAAGSAGALFQGGGGGGSSATGPAGAGGVGGAGAGGGGGGTAISGTGGAGGAGGPGYLRVTTWRVA